METQAKVARHLLQIKAIKLNPQKPFTWASGLQAPIYCDNRIILSYPAIRSFIVQCFADVAESFAPFDVVAGVATAGIPHGILLAEKLKLPFIYVRPEPKGHGRQNQVEGDWQEGARVLVIEDLLSTGGSSLKAVAALREVGCRVQGVIAIFTYGFPQVAEGFTAADCPYRTLTEYPALLKEAESQQYIQPDDLAMLQEWHRDHLGWSKTFGTPT